VALVRELPRAVRIREVGPRDGFQNEPEVIPTERKVELIDALARTGIRRLEVTSFVRADVIPQLADAAEVLARVDVPAEVSVSVLIPNERGLENALSLREAHSGSRPAFDEVNVFLSASETHNQKNVNTSIAGSLAGVEAVLRRARDAGLRCEGVISTSFGCPYEGPVPPQRVFEIAARLRDAGAQEVGFGDTTGMANPRQVGEFFRAARACSPRSRRALTASSRASASWAAAPSPQGRRATSPARTSCRCCTRWASRPASTCPR
jgi:hydroxymethylglutaryl-CoA lyase